LVPINYFKVNDRTSSWRPQEKRGEEGGGGGGIKRPLVIASFAVIVIKFDEMEEDLLRSEIGKMQNAFENEELLMSVVYGDLNYRGT